MVNLSNTKKKFNSKTKKYELNHANICESILF